jgi:hypothetical protein
MAAVAQPLLLMQSRWLLNQVHVQLHVWCAILFSATSAAAGLQVRVYVDGQLAGLYPIFYTFYTVSLESHNTCDCLSLQWCVCKPRTDATSMSHAVPLLR